MARGRKSSIWRVLAPEERATLAHWPRSTMMAAGLGRRGRRLLLRADGHSHAQVARALPVPRTVVRTGARRFLAPRREGRSDAPGRGAKSGFSPRGRDPRGTPGR
jgi:hypothetical protein